MWLNVVTPQVNVNIFNKFLWSSLGRAMTLIQKDASISVSREKECAIRRLASRFCRLLREIRTRLEEIQRVEGLQRSRPAQTRPLGDCA